MAPDEVCREIVQFETKSQQDVELERQKGEDGLCRWVKQLPTGMFKSITQDLQDAHKDVLRFYGNAALEKEDPWADPWVIALALLNSGTVITEESSRGKGMQSKIPYICGRLQVSCMTMLGLFRETKTVF